MSPRARLLLLVMLAIAGCATDAGDGHAGDDPTSEPPPTDTIEEPPAVGKTLPLNIELAGGIDRGAARAY